MKNLVSGAVLLTSLILSFGVFGATVEVLDVQVDSPYSYDISDSITADSVEIIFWVDFDSQADKIWKYFYLNGVEGVVHLREIIYVVGGIDITDWHEELWVYKTKTRSWVPSPNDDGIWWGDGNNGGAAPQITPGAQVVIDHPNDAVDIYFTKPQSEGQIIIIEKDILVPACETLFAIVQWPTVPEPSITLIALAALPFIRRKK
jgi:hypothetical protein